MESVAGEHDNFFMIDKVTWHYHAKSLLQSENEMGRTS